MQRFEFINREDDDSNKPEEDHSVHPIFGIILIAFLFSLYGFVFLIDGILPTPLYITDEKNNPDAFITERARNDLKLLTDIGPRVMGTYENEILAVNFLNETIAKIQQEAHPNQKIDFDLQSTSVFRYKKRNGSSVYADIQNVVVKLHSGNYSNHSLLVNMHFDSVENSPGASDDGINCVIALEVLRKLSRSPKKLLHNIIFLFNGAEEAGLLGSKGFIAQHKWAKEARVVVNFEAAGAGGKILLFQTGPKQPWLLDYYSKVPHPHGHAFGEEIFQAGLISSDTDYKIFVLKGMVGLDFAFIKNANRYHTKFDDFAHIPLGTYQHAGDNALLLIRDLANAPELANPQGQSKSNTVFYDFLGLFLVHYSDITAIFINVKISILSIIITVKSFYDFRRGSSCQFLLYIVITWVANLLGWIGSGLLVKIISLTINGLGRSMSWYRNQWIVLGLYVPLIMICPCGFIMLINHLKFIKKINLSLSVQTQIQAHTLRLTWTILLLIGTSFGLRSVYIILLPVLFETIAFSIIHVSCLQHSIRKWQVIYTVALIIPTIFLMQIALILIRFLISRTGFMGSDEDTEMFIGTLTLLATALITSAYIPLVTLLRKSYLILACLIGIFLLFFIIVFTPLGYPYSDDPDSPAPQRFDDWTSILSQNKT